MKIRKLAHILFLVAILFIFLLLPKSITTSAQYSTTAFVVGMGVDKSENLDGVSLCAQIVAGKPNAASSESYQIVSADGIDVVEAVDNLRKQLGKTLGLSHCYVIVVSDDICNKYNLATLLDPIVRTERLGTNVILAHTNKKAKDLLLACEEIGGDAQNVLENLTKYNNEYLLNKDASIYDFYQDYNSQHKTGFMVTIDFKEQDQKQAQKSGSGDTKDSQISQTQSNNTLPQKKIVNNGTAVAFYEGKKAAVVNEDVLKGLGWIDCTSKFNTVKLHNINTEKLKNATITQKASINNGTPSLHLDLFVKAKIIAVEDENLISITNLSELFDKVFEDKLQELVMEESSKACEFQREHNLDILNFYQVFNTQIHNEWQNYLKTLDNKDEYATKIQVFVKTHLTQAN